MGKRLYRSRSDRVISGVCGGLAAYFEVDPTLVRVVVAALAIISHGGILIAYLVMAVALPEEPPAESVAVRDRATAVSEREGLPVNESEDRPYAEVEQPPPAPAQAPAPAPAGAPQAGVPGTGRRTWSGLGWGLALIVIGGLLLLNEFVPTLDIWRLWPLLIVAAGIGTIWKGVRR